MANYPTGVFAPAAKTAGQTIDAAHINDLQDEVVAIENALLNGVAHNLTLNSTGVLTVAAQPRSLMVSTAVQAISSSQSTGTRLTFEATNFDVGSAWSTTTNAYTAPSSGAYLVHAAILSAIGDPAGNLLVNVGTGAVSFAYVSTHAMTQQVTAIVNVNAGASIYVGLKMDSTVTRNFGSTASQFYKQLYIQKLC